MKRIGWLRIGNPIDVDYMDSNVFTLNTGVRLGCWEAFVQLGYKVHLLSWVKPKHRHLLFRGGLGCEGFYNYDWLPGNVLYDINADLDDLDFIVLEYGPANTLFSHSPDDEDFIDWVGMDTNVSYWYYLSYLLEAAEGHRLVYFTANGNRQLFMRCPLLKEQAASGDYIVRAEPELADSNIRVIFEGIDWSNYQWEVWSNALNTQELVNLHKGSLPGATVSGWYSTPVGYSDACDPLMEIQSLGSMDCDFVYVGHQRDSNRTKKLMKFFGPYSHEYAIDVWGKWKTEQFDTMDVQFMGPTKNQGVTPLLYNDAVASLFVGEKAFEKMGTMTPRIMIASRAGNIVFMDRDVHRGAEMVGGEEFLVGDADELMDKYDRVSEYNSASMRRRARLVEKQRSMYRPWRDYIGKIIDGVPDVTTVPLWER